VGDKAELLSSARRAVVTPSMSVQSSSL
jgi:hypothetical protein